MQIFSLAMTKPILFREIRSSKSGKSDRSYTVMGSDLFRINPQFVKAQHEPTVYNNLSFLKKDLS